MRSSHETAEPALVRVLTSEARGAIGWLEQLGCSFARERRLPPRPLRRRDAERLLGRRPDGARHHEGAARGVRSGEGDVLAHHRLTELAPGDNGWLATCS